MQALGIGCEAKPRGLALLSSHLTEVSSYHPALSLYSGAIQTGYQFLGTLRMFVSQYSYIPFAAFSEYSSKTPNNTVGTSQLTAPLYR